MRHIFRVLFFLSCLTCMANAEENLAFIEVAEGVFMFEGAIEEIFSTEKGMVSNVTFIIGTSAVAVIDTGASFNQGKLIYQAIRAQTPLPVKYIINTHVHLDHIFGNQAFVRDNPQVIAHKNFPAELAAKGQYYKDRLVSPWYAGTEIVAPDRLISGQEIIDLGDRRLTLTAMKRAHTNHDLMIFDQKTKTLITGDLVFVEHIPVIDGSLPGWLDTLGEIQRMEFSLLIPGHGPVQHDKSAIVKMRSYFTKLRTAVRKAIDDHMDLDTASNILLQDQAKHWRLFEDFHKRNVITAYSEAEWE